MYFVFHEDGTYNMYDGANKVEDCPRDWRLAEKDNAIILEWRKQVHEPDQKEYEWRVFWGEEEDASENVTEFANKLLTWQTSYYLLDDEVSFEDT